MSKSIVAYFSCTGTTQRVAETLAQAIGAELYEIEPREPYTSADLNWNNKKSRSSVEMDDPKSRPELGSTLPDLTGCTHLFVGFPIWWYTAPHIINSFLEACKPQGLKVIPFCTSGGSGITRACKEIAPSCPGAEVVSGRHFSAAASAAELKSWAEGI